MLCLKKKFFIHLSAKIFYFLSNNNLIFLLYGHLIYYPSKQQQSQIY